LPLETRKRGQTNKRIIESRRQRGQQKTSFQLRSTSWALHFYPHQELLLLLLLRFLFLLLLLLLGSGKKLSYGASRMLLY